MTKNWFSENKIEQLELPSQFPDLKPIEHIQDDVKKYVFKGKPSNVEQLWASVRSA